MPEPYISIHALREEGDRHFNLNAEVLTLFLSTPSARRATKKEAAADVPAIISIHALREEGDSFVQCCAETLIISIHALREEGDAVYA